MDDAVTIMFEAMAEIQLKVITNKMDMAKGREYLKEVWDGMDADTRKKIGQEVFDGSQKMVMIGNAIHQEFHLISRDDR